MQPTSGCVRSLRSLRFLRFPALPARASLRQPAPWSPNSTWFSTRYQHSLLFSPSEAGKRVSVAPTHDPLYSQATGFGPLSFPLNQDRLHRFVGQILGQMLFDFKTQKWVALANTAAWSCWSRDGQYVYFLHEPQDGGVFRVGIRDRKVEQTLSLKGFQLTGYFGSWLGLALDDSPLLLKDMGSQEIVALDWQTP